METDLENDYQHHVNLYLEAYTDQLLDDLGSSVYGEFVLSLGYGDDGAVDEAIATARVLVQDHLESMGIGDDEPGLVDRIVNAIDKDIVLAHIRVDCTCDYRRHYESVYSMNMGETEIDLIDCNSEFMVEHSLKDEPEFFKTYGYYSLNDHIVHAVLDIEGVVASLTTAHQE